MQAITFPIAYDNEAAHRQVKLLMKQGKQLNIRIEDEQESKVKELVEQKCNIACIPFLRETQAFVKLRGLYKFGKLFFSIRRSDDFMDYLNEKGL